MTTKTQNEAGNEGNDTQCQEEDRVATGSYEWDTGKYRKLANFCVM